MNHIENKDIADNLETGQGREVLTRQLLFTQLKSCPICRRLFFERPLSSSHWKECLGCLPFCSMAFRHNWKGMLAEKQNQAGPAEGFPFSVLFCSPDLIIYIYIYFLFYYAESGILPLASLGLTQRRCYFCLLRNITSLAIQRN